MGAERGTLRRSHSKAIRRSTVKSSGHRYAEIIRARREVTAAR
ncbi:hypothetical protein [Streptomyces lateritius]|nr:hypothetical protein [Streptomyces lateritius]